MLTLIGREFHDHAVHVVLICLISTLAIAVTVLTVVWPVEGAILRVNGAFLVTLLILFCALGAAQMYGDRANRISSLLATLAVTRSRILAARVLAGLVIIMLALIPFFIATVMVLHSVGPPLVLYWRTIVEVSATVVLMSLACYCIGLQTSWTANKVVPVLGTPMLVALLTSLAVIKGVGLSAIVLLVLFTVASLIRVWYRFASVSL